MNEQLIVKNFGPITDATVDFKRVTVFIGPTGGGKSTLAKLAAIFRKSEYNIYINNIPRSINFLADFSLTQFRQTSSEASFVIGKPNEKTTLTIDFEKSVVIEASNGIKHESSKIVISDPQNNVNELKEFVRRLENSDDFAERNEMINLVRKFFFDTSEQQNLLRQSTSKRFYTQNLSFFPASRAILPSIEYSWPGLLRDNIGLPKDLLDFANDFSLSRKDVSELNIPFFKVKYTHINGRDFIKIPNLEEPLMLLEAASGIQSVTPLLVLLEHLSRNTEQAQSFIIEEPELNLYPTAQQGLLNWLVEKCTKGENDLTITTHSPYLLAHLNLLLFAFQVAEKHPDRAEEVAKIIPRESWLDPKEFAAYHVEGQQENGVHSIVNLETGLISYNGLDAIASAETSEFEKLLDINAGLEVE